MKIDRTDFKIPKIIKSYRGIRKSAHGVTFQVIFGLQGAEVSFSNPGSTIGRLR